MPPMYIRSIANEKERVKEEMRNASSERGSERRKQLAAVIALLRSPGCGLYAGLTQPFPHFRIRAFLTPVFITRYRVPIRSQLDDDTTA